MWKLKRVKASLIIAGVIIFFVVYAHDRTPRQPVTGHLQNAEMNETSGITASKTNPGVYYIHNDSGDSARFFAITDDGKLKAELRYNGVYPAALHVGDCEDIAVGPGPDTTKSYVYIGDIGDNTATRPFLTIYRTEEPTFGKDSVMKVDATPVHVKYPDGAKDAETMMVDPVEKLLYIVSKRKGAVSVYTAPLTYKPNDTLTLTYRTQLHFGGLQPLKWIVGGSISADGSQVLLKSYIHIYYWRREGKEPIWQTMTRKPQKVAYHREKQGEAVGFALDGKSYYTIGEGLHAPIYHFYLP